MTMGPVSEQRLALVHPFLAAKIRTLAEQLPEAIGVTQGLRSNAEQAALYAEGRIPIDQVNALRVKVGWAAISVANRTVTDAQPGYSWHNMGLAIDVVPFESSNAADWNLNHPIWAEIVKQGEALGLVSGIEWHDEPHFQWTCQYPETPTDVVRQLFAQGGLQAVWNSLKIG
jgi:peptidoglycan LD-endopeptidase CwlK